MARTLVPCKLSFVRDLIVIWPLSGSRLESSYLNEDLSEQIFRQVQSWDYWVATHLQLQYSEKFLRKLVKSMKLWFPKLGTTRIPAHDNCQFVGHCTDPTRRKNGNILIWPLAENWRDKSFPPEFWSTQLLTTAENQSSAVDLFAIQSESISGYSYLPIFAIW